MSDSVAATTSIKDTDAKIVWVDCEMTGLDPEKERIIEIAIAVTDGELTETVEGPNLVIHQPDELLNQMDAWNKNQHGNSGLTERVRCSKISEKDAEGKLLEFLQEHCPMGKCPLAGNSVYMDKIFLMKSMPRLCDYLHYRLIDVSTLKELSKRWRPDVSTSAPEKKSTHRALEDIHESIEELRHYKKSLFGTNM